MSKPTFVVFLCKQTSKLERVVVHLKKNGFKPYVFVSIKQVVAFMLKEQPRHIFISWNYNPEPIKFMRTLNKMFSTECIPFAENGDRTTSTAMTKSGFRDIVLYPVSGESVQRILDRRNGMAAQAAHREVDQTVSLSKIQIRVTADDIPELGQWEEIAGRPNMWYFKTDVKLKNFGKKNGRFIYSGERIPDRKPNGKWNIDHRKGKLEFEILNIVEESKQSAGEVYEAVENLTEDEAILRLTKAMGVSVDQIDKDAGFSEEAIFQEERGKDISLVGAEVDSLADDIARNLETGFLDEEDRRIKLSNEAKKQDSPDIEKEQTMEDEGVNLFKGDVKDPYYSAIQEGQEAKNHKATQEGPGADGGHTIFKGEESVVGNHLTGMEDKEKSDLTIGDRAKEKENDGNFGDVEYQRKSALIASSGNEEGKEKLSRIEKKYRPKIEGTKSELALLVHTQNVTLKKIEGDDLDSPVLVNECTRLGVITIVSRMYKGYFVCATGENKRPDLDRLEQIREALMNKLTADGHGPRDMLVAEIDIPKINFKEWAIKNSNFISLAQVKGEEVAIAFIDANGKMPSEELSKSQRMQRIPFLSVVPDTVIDFDFYLYLPKNDRFILYVKRHDIYTHRQVRNVEKSNHCYIRADHLDQYKIYCAKMYIWSKIDQSRKEYKAS